MPVAGDAVQPLGDVQPLDLQLRGPAGLGLQDDAPDAEAVLGELVAVGRDAEEDLLAHQSRLVERDQAGGVGVVAVAVGGLELDHRHAAAGLLVDDLDGEVAAGVRRRGDAGSSPARQRHEKHDCVGIHALHDSPATAALRPRLAAPRRRPVVVPMNSPSAQDGALSGFPRDRTRRLDSRSRGATAGAYATCEGGSSARVGWTRHAAREARRQQSCPASFPPPPPPAVRPDRPRSRTAPAHIPASAPPVRRASGRQGPLRSPP